MAKQYKDQKVVKSSDGRRDYIVSLNFDGTYECSCRGWTSHVPRQDCKHIQLVKLGGGKSYGEAAMERLK